MISFPDHAPYIRIEPLQERVSEARIALAKMFTEKQIDWANKVIDAYLARLAGGITCDERGRK